MLDCAPTSRLPPNAGRLLCFVAGDFCATSGDESDERSCATFVFGGTGGGGDRG